MVRQRISELLILVSVFLIITGGASAAPQENPSVSPGVPDQGQLPYSITLFIPTQNSIHSDQINDIINGPFGSDEVIIGTSFGLSIYNGTWSTRHINQDNISEGLMDDFISAVELDNKGNLWIGYSGGLQIFNGHTYQSIRDQQLLKDPRVHELQRWDDDMWVATGNAGIHRYRNSTWTWFQPMTRTGPGFYEIDSMVLDTAGDALIIATDDEGQWIVRSPGDPVLFERLNSGEDTLHPLRHVRRDPLGGAYFFNQSTVIHYSTITGFVPTLTTGDLASSPVTINDIAAGADGRIYLATDDGLYIWDDGSVLRHISGLEGIGPSHIVKTIFVDAENRAWFSTQGYVGFYRETPGTHSFIPVERVIAVITNPVTEETVTPVVTTTPAPTPEPTPVPGFLAGIFDPITQAIRALTEKLGIKLP